MPTRRPLIALLPLALAVPTGLVVAAHPATALAPSITVDEWADELNADGDCSLREAVATINTGVAADACALPADPVIDVPSSIAGHLGATLQVTQSMTIRGTLGLPADVDCSAVVGNCIENVGAGSDLDLENLWISSATEVQVYAALGAGHLHLHDVSVWGGSNGVVSQGGDVALLDSTSWYSAGWGVFSLNGDIVIDHALIGGNDEGAVYGDLADITVTSSSIYDNEGYGVFGQSGDVEIVNTTIKGNGADASRTHDGTVTFRSATLVGNRRALDLTGPGQIRFSNTVVAESDLGNCADPLVSLGFNVSDDGTCGFDQATDRTAIDPGLSPFDDLQAMPGYPLLADSALIDTGGDCPAVDELDGARPTDGDGDGTATCDVGAIEAPGVPVVPEPVDPTDPTDPSEPGTGSSSTTAVPATPVAATPHFTG